MTTLDFHEFSLFFIKMKHLISFFYFRVQTAHGAKVAAIQTDHGGEFENNFFNEFCDEQGIKHQYSSPRTP